FEDFHTQLICLFCLGALPLHHTCSHRPGGLESSIRSGCTGHCCRPSTVGTGYAHNLHRPTALHVRPRSEGRERIGRRAPESQSAAATTKYRQETEGSDSLRRGGIGPVQTASS